MARHLLYVNIQLHGSMSVDITQDTQHTYTCEEYTDLITSEHRKPKFMAFVESMACPFAEISRQLDLMLSKMDVDTAEGDQLDIIGEWVGADRVLGIDTSEASLYFSFDVVGAGWDYAIWYDGDDPEVGMSKVEDSVYRMLVKAKIASNMWNGTSEQANSLWKDVFEGSNIYFIDNFDMTMGVYVSGLSIDSVIYQLIVQGYLAIKPAGVRIAYYVLGPENPRAKTFAWSTNTDVAGGWGEGYWVQKVDIPEYDDRGV